MSIRVLVNGAAGRMGRITTKTIKQDAAFDLVAETHSSDELKKYLLSSKATIAIDFTNAAVVFENAKSIILAGTHPVIGTSGLRPEQIMNYKSFALRKT